MLYNAQGRYGDARDAARRVLEHQVVGAGAFAVPELAESAARTGEVALVRTALAWLSERTRRTPTKWALGIEARVRALLTDDEAGYLESIEQLARTGRRVQLARSHLVYGEWLSRQNRRLDARAQLRTAYDMLADMGAEGFAERARCELQAIGETVRKRTAETVRDLTEQEAYIARLAVDGRTNAEIGAQMVLSARTVEWHLRKVYTKLGVGSRRELGRALATGGRLPGPGSGAVHATTGGARTTPQGTGQGRPRARGAFRSATLMPVPIRPTPTPALTLASGPRALSARRNRLCFPNQRQGAGDESQGRRGRGRRHLRGGVRPG